jgi:predicted transposase YdaD
LQKTGGVLSERLRIVVDGAACLQRRGCEDRVEQRADPRGSEEIMQESVIYQDILQKGEIRGEIRGEFKGELKTLLRIFRHRFGALAPEIEGQIATLNQNSLDDLSIAQIGFQQIADLEKWLASHVVRM